MSEIKTVDKKSVENLFEVGAHFGYIKSRRHPSTAPFIFGRKDKVEIFDLEKTASLLDEAKAHVFEIAAKGQQVLFVTGKKHLISMLKDTALRVDQPYVIGRWIGGTLTNFEEMQKRIKRLGTLLTEKEKGLLAKYTKKERLLIDREIDKLTERFGGVTNMKQKPGALFIIDTRQEDIATAEAKKEKIPVIGLCSTDCNLNDSQFPIPANDTSVKSVKYILDEIANAYAEGAKSRNVDKKEEVKK